MENISFSPVDPLLFLRQIPEFLAKKKVDKDIEAKKDVNGEITSQTTIETSNFQSTPPTYK